MSIILWLSTVYRDRGYKYESLYMLLYDIGGCNAGIENRHIMVHLQRLLPIKIKISNIMYRNDRLHNTINNLIPFAIHLQLLHKKF